VTERMRFGKYRGVAIRDLPDAYLSWLRAQGWVREPLRRILEAEHARRVGGQGEVALRVPLELRATARTIVDLGYRAAAKRLHPDAGGDDRAMARVNGAVEALRVLIGAAA